MEGRGMTDQNGFVLPEFQENVSLSRKKKSMSAFCFVIFG